MALSGTGSFRLVVASGFGDHRDDSRDPVCYQSNLDLHQQKAVEQLAAILAELLRFLKSSAQIWASSFDTDRTSRDKSHRVNAPLRLQFLQEQI